MDMTNFMKDSPNKSPNTTTGSPSVALNNKYLSNNLTTTTTSTSSSNASSCSSHMGTTNPNNCHTNNNNNNINTHNSLSRNTNQTSFELTNGASAKLSSNGQTHHVHYPLEDCSIKKKAASIDSINAVERELDEVLKDLELNSQDLNEHLSMDSEPQPVAKNIIELPITIQKNIKIEQCTSVQPNGTSSPLFNKPNPYHQQHHQQQFGMNNANQSRWNNQYVEAHNNRVNNAYGASKIPNGAITPPPQTNSDFSGLD